MFIKTGNKLFNLGDAHRIYTNNGDKKFSICIWWNIPGFGEQVISFSTATVRDQAMRAIEEGISSGLNLVDISESFLKT